MHKLTSKDHYECKKYLETKKNKTEAKNLNETTLDIM